MKTVSKIVEFPLTSTYSINVTITKKRMKNMRLTISKSGNVKVSIPYSTSYNYAYQFLIRRRSWISDQLNKIRHNQAKDSCHFCNNGNIFLLGNNYPLKVEIGTRNLVVFNPSLNHNPTLDFGFTIYIKDSAVDVRAVFIKWCKKYFLDFFTNRLNYIYAQMFNNTAPPTIKIKTMKSMWGNCNFVKRVVTLNLYLAKTSIECIDYVITHELAHLVHHNHSKEFHNLMTKLLPDWKQRKKQLNNYSLSF